jgi:hypothetical protein
MNEAGAILREKNKDRNGQISKRKPATPNMHHTKMFEKLKPK